jgi:chemotaxis family two-component system sensor kinase Cph1
VNRESEDLSDRVRVTPAMLAACASEPIHIPGAIQAHGALITVADPSLVVQQASATCGDWLGVSAADLVGHDLRHALPALAAILTAGRFRWNEQPQIAPQTLTVRGRELALSIHRDQSALLVEVEAADAVASAGSTGDLASLQRLSTDIVATRDPIAAADLVAEAVHQLTGYDRVMIYRFDADGHGEVVAQRLNPGVESFLGHHYPASDIPPQARAMFHRLRVRVINDSRHQPVPLIPREDPRGGRPLDLSRCVLRAVSPIHLEYLRNMHVSASLSAAILINDQLWGLVACQHHAPRGASLRLRADVGLAATLLAGHLAGIETQRRLYAQIEAERVQRELLAGIRIDERSHWSTELMAPGRVLPLVNAHGAILDHRGVLLTAGEVPPEPQIAILLAYVREHLRGDILHVDDLPERLPALAAFAYQASGCLAVRLSDGTHGAEGDGDLLVWLRAEQLRQITWAGDPTKTARASDPTRLSPRTSFAAWKETVRHRSAEWTFEDRAAASAMRYHLRTVVGRVYEVKRLLARSNRELDEFARSASHDLQEPLRTVRTACALLDAHVGLLPGDSAQFLHLARDAADRGLTLVADLLDFARLDHDPATTAPVDLTAACREAVRSLHQAISEAGAVIDVNPLPTVPGRRHQLVQLFQNLIGNAVKYHGAEPARVRISAVQRPDAWEISVGDNGIGIDPKFHEHIFTIFKRLHSKRVYPGTGIGLALCKKIVELHGGRISVDSSLGAGATFRFTLSTAGPGGSAGPAGEPGHG